MLNFAFEKNTMKNLCLMAFILLMTLSCGDEDGQGEIVGCPGGFEVTGRDFRSFPDCSFVYELQDGTFIILVNDDEFGVTIVDGGQYRIIAEQLINALAPCMEAKLYQLMCIERI